MGFLRKDKAHSNQKHEKKKKQAKKGTENSYDSKHISYC